MRSLFLRKRCSRRDQEEFGAVDFEFEEGEGIVADDILEAEATTTMMNPRERLLLLKLLVLRKRQREEWSCD